MSNLRCQLDWIQRQLRGKPWSTPTRDLPHQVNWHGKTHPECGHHLPGAAQVGLGLRGKHSYFACFPWHLPGSASTLLLPPSATASQTSFCSLLMWTEDQNSPEILQAFSWGVQPRGLSKLWSSTSPVWRWLWLGPPTWCCVIQSKESCL